MSLDVKTETGTKRDPVFKLILEDIRGGITFLVDRIPTATKEIAKGALLYKVTAAASLGQYRLIKTAKLVVPLGTVNVSTLQVYTNQEFKVGEYIGAPSAAGSAVSITAITKLPSTDLILTVAGFSAAVVASGVVLMEGSANNTSYAPLYAASVILRQSVQVRESDLTTLRNVHAGAVVRGTVNEATAAYFVTSADKTALTDRIRWE